MNRLIHQLVCHFLAALILSLTGYGANAKDSYVMPKLPPELSTSETLKLAVKNPDDPRELMNHLLALRQQNWTCLDLSIDKLRAEEYHAVIKANPRDSANDRLKMVNWIKAVTADLNEISRDNRTHPAREAEAILKRLDEVGTGNQFGPLLELYDSLSTSVSRWKVATTLFSILERRPLAEIIPHFRLSHSLIPFLRDLSPARRAELASILAELELKAGRFDISSTPHGVPPYLWIADAISHHNPETAKKLFTHGLESTDPAVRLFAGLGLNRISDIPIPFRATESRLAVEKARTKWIGEMKVRPADDWSFRDPAADPVVKHYLNGPTELWWFNAAGQLVRCEEDVWPGVYQVLADGTYFASTSGTNMRTGLITPDGEVLTRMPSYVPNVQAENAERSLGYFYVPRKDSMLTEYSVTGEVLWEQPLREGFDSYRSPTWGGPGRILVIKNNTVELLDRRGDTVWSIRENLEDARWACMVAPETVLIANKQSVVMIDRHKGLLKKIGPFISVSRVRYHPTKPWIVFDGGRGHIYFIDPETSEKTKAELSYYGSNFDKPARSKWRNKGWPYP